MREWSGMGTDRSGRSSLRVGKVFFAYYDLSRGARKRGGEEGIVKSLTERASKSNDLLVLDETIRRLKPFSRHYVGMRPIPVSRVVGTDGRAGDFDRRFSPRKRHIRER